MHANKSSFFLCILSCIILTRSYTQTKESIEWAGVDGSRLL